MIVGGLSAFETLGSEDGGGLVLSGWDELAPPTPGSFVVNVGDAAWETHGSLKKGAPSLSKKHALQAPTSWTALPVPGCCVRP